MESRKGNQLTVVYGGIFLLYFLTNFALRPTFAICHTPIPPIYISYIFLLYIFHSLFFL